MEVKLKNGYDRHGPRSLWEVLNIREDLDSIPTVIENQTLFNLIKLLADKGILTEEEIFDNLTDSWTKYSYEKVEEN